MFLGLGKGIFQLSCILSLLLDLLVFFLNLLLETGILHFNLHELLHLLLYFLFILLNNITNLILFALNLFLQLSFTSTLNFQIRLQLINLLCLPLYLAPKLLLPPPNLPLGLLDLGPQRVSLPDHRLAVASRTQSKELALFFELVEAHYEPYLIIQFSFDIIAHERNGSLHYFAIGDFIDIPNAVLENVEVLGVAADLSEGPVVEALIHKVFHTDRKDGRIILLAIIEENTLPLGHLRGPLRLLGPLPIIAFFIKEIQNGVDSLLRLAHLRNHQQGALRLIEPQIELVVLGAAKHAAWSFVAIEG